MTEAITDALFVRDGDHLLPGVPALGPWRRDALHGGAVSALLAGSLEREGYVLARTTVDLLGRVPAEPLRLVTEDEWGSTRLRRQTVELWAGDRIVARAQGLRLPEASLALPPGAIAPARWEVPQVDDAEWEERQAAIVANVGYPSFVSHAIAMRFVEGNFATVGPSTTWLKLMVPVVSGEPLTGVQRVAAAADYANGGLAELPFREWSFMSVDLTVQLTRPPIGEWMAIACSAFAQPTGVGMGDAELHDETGRVGQSTSTLLVEPR